MSKVKEKESIISRIKNKLSNLTKYQKIMIFIMVFYTIISFHNLGNFESPRTFLNLKNNQYVIFDFEKEVVPKEIVYFGGFDDTYISIFLANELSDDNSSFNYDGSVTSDYTSVLEWQRKPINEKNTSCRYIMVSSYWDTTSMGELCFLDGDGKKIEMKLIDGDGEALVDEQDTLQYHITYMNSSYFDEVYFPRAAYEIFNNKYIFEYTHPPLGKLIMWIPISIFGMSPFTYRFMGNVAGILMVLVMYYIGKEMFNHEKYGVFAATIMALDGMHFTQTRIGTVDSFLALFSIMAFLFFIKYLKCKGNEPTKEMYKWLLLSGASWGCAMSTKWNPAFVGIGLGILFFIDYIKNKKIVFNKKFNYKPIIMGATCFVAVPIVIYLASYLPIYWNPNEVCSYDVFSESGDKTTETAKPNSIKGFLLYQYSMYQYHSSLGPEKNPDYYEHPFMSRWYTWPVSYKPMWYFVGTYDDNMKSTIAAMGNPAIWWLTCISALYTLFHMIFSKDKNGLFLVIMILATWLPYSRITRDMYIYHYFIVLPYMMLTIVYMVSRLANWKPKFEKLVPILCAIFLLFFIYFYPIYSGKIVSDSYIESTKWFDSWIY